MNSATKVGEIFTAAGQAFSRLGDLTMQLHPNAESPSGKWTDEEIDMLHSSIMRFSDDLSKISLSIKNRTVSQIRQALKKKAFEDAGIPAKQVPVQQVQHVIQTVQQLPIVQQQQQPQQQHVFKSHIIQQQQPQQQQVQQQAKQIILQPQQSTTTTTTTVTIKQFQQMQQQKAAALAAAQAAAAAAAAANTPTITENIIIQQPTSTTAMQQTSLPIVATTATQQIIVPANSNSSVLSPSVGATAVTAGAVGAVVVAEDVVSTTSNTSTNAGLKCGPDVSMTLNRINVQENDVEECLPAEVVKLDFVSEEVAG
ncbi:PREDICTED: polyglutamine-repeat protein pqn-41 isoform X1 [Drosophila arizonae]|uniref:Polyglutamine-repeat protein pqn-41 isoform X1 n=1 Tax=Drosophila arizonae TaxID=7263 RepID=A0ABM1NWR1_DROAR|nr:PREDICTED: polyglutamine-repeat protein pqn-41 isoform X1 [Drosophila arizonae]